MQAIKQFLQDESGVTAIEYALIAAVVAVVMVVGAKLLGTSLSSAFSGLGTTVSPAAAS